VASQFHPEFKSRPDRPHPLFDGFVAASIAVADGEEPVLRARPEPSPSRQPATPTPAPPAETVTPAGPSGATRPTIGEGTASRVRPT
jgi:hypothetical protein